jgi:hypothetical protein
MGWVTVVAYFITGWLCLRALRAEKHGPPRPLFATLAALLRVLRKHWPRPPLPARRAALWLLLALLMFALGINKQLDLQSLVTELGKAAAHAGGWYEQRRGVQVAFIAIVGLSGMLALAVLWWLTRGQLRDFRITLVGLATILCYVVIRAASFHHVDILIRSEVLGVRMNWIFELGGIAIMAGGVVLRLRACRAATPAA